MALPKINDPRIEEIEDAGCDEGRFFVHLKDAWDWNIDPGEVRRSTMFGSRKEVTEALKKVRRSTTFGSRKEVMEALKKVRAALKKEGFTYKELLAAVERMK